MEIRVHKVKGNLSKFNRGGKEIEKDKQPISLNYHQPNYISKQTLNSIFHMATNVT